MTLSLATSQALILAQHEPKKCLENWSLHAVTWYPQTTWKELEQAKSVKTKVFKRVGPVRFKLEDMEGHNLGVTHKSCLS